VASRSEHLAALLADQLGMHWTWTASPAPERWQQRLGDPIMQVGNAILSRWPITDHATQPLPTASADNDGRTVLLARVQTPTGPVPFFTTQLTSTIGQSRVRRQQVAALCRFIAAHASPGFPPVVTGDLNAEPDADEVRLLGGHKTARWCPAWSWWTPGGTPTLWRRAGPGTGATPTSPPPGNPAPGSTTCWSGRQRPLAPAVSGRPG
jgi:endonuclease/exonuclease/phosphatase family metal-dependent hydrolase